MTLTPHLIEVAERRTAERFASIRRFAEPSRHSRTPTRLRQPHSRAEFAALTTQAREGHLLARVAEQVVEELLAELSPEQTPRPRRTPPPLASAHEARPPHRTPASVAYSDSRTQAHTTEGVGIGSVTGGLPTERLSKEELWAERRALADDDALTARYFVPCAGGCGRMLAARGPRPQRRYCDGWHANRQRQSRSWCHGLPSQSD